jgi:hypothetical protein
MAWGIRGQYGHETGAMMAGLLVGLVMLLLFRPQATSLAAARAVALCTVAIGFGGAETYGQTIGLTQNAINIGRWDCLAWGMLGLAIKGGIWIGFAGVFLGMGLSGVRYRSLEMLTVMVVLLVLFAAGVWLVNMPFDPAHRVLPKIYFSASWHWEPDALPEKLKPRREVWGGLLLALIAVIAYVGIIKRDRLARRLGYWAILGGAIGFPFGQSLQAYHAWNKELFRTGFWAQWDPHINWWNMMETTFGVVAGIGIGLGLWLNRRSIAPLDAPSEVTIRPPIEWFLAAVHVFLLMTSEFQLWDPTQSYAEYSLLLGLIPIVAIVGGRWWPYLLVLPITLLPIATKTVRYLAYDKNEISQPVAWVIYLALPLALALATIVYFGRRWQESASKFLSGTLLLTTWLYFALNYAFFFFPWPWVKWTIRTPNGIIYAICALGLTALVLTALRRAAKSSVATVGNAMR